MSLAHKRLTVAVLAAAVIAAAGALHVHAVVNENPTEAPTQLTGVDVATVVSRGIIDWRSYSGRLEAVDHVEIRPEVSGTIVSVHFRDGSRVEKDELLFTIDPRPYQAVVDRARAQLAAAEARAAYTASELARSQRLLADNAIARRDHDQRQNAAREAAANLQAARAELATANLNLSHTRITAPVAGRVSRAEVTLGNLVSAGAASPPLTTLVSMAQMYAAFDVDEQSFLKLINPAITGDAPIPVLLGLADEDGYSRAGQVSSVDNRLDTASGTIRVRAVFDNPDGSLVPGLYARIRLGGGSERTAALIDGRAIGTDQDKRFVLVVDEANRTAYREVQLGASVDGLRVIESGLEPGERIVVNGLQRIRPGETIQPQVVPMAGTEAVDPIQPATPARGVIVAGEGLQS
ncbi:MAG TPA: efflux RND transporter periplasmic adaptor subunit [Rhodocyclaceae bacterium]|nr:efflux RND transporter periplasmic adaptor subunit [Rhodocyclaceae bacterium]